MYKATPLYLSELEVLDDGVDLLGLAVLQAEDGALSAGARVALGGGGAVGTGGRGATAKAPWRAGRLRTGLGQAALLRVQVGRGAGAPGTAASTTGAAG